MEIKLQMELKSEREGARGENENSNSVPSRVESGTRILRLE